MYWTEWGSGSDFIRSVNRDGDDPQLHHDANGVGEVVTTAVGVAFPVEHAILRIDGS